MELFEAIRTTRSMRRLDPDRPVSDQDIETIVGAGLRGPSGGNQQPVRWLVIRDAETKQKLQVIYQRCWDRGRKRYDEQPGLVASNVLNSADHLAANLHLVPVLILVCAETGSAKARHHASVYPGVQNLMLAARELGLGTTLTTAHLFEEDEVRTLLDIPADVTTYALIPVGYPLGRWGEAKRPPVSSVTYQDRWGRLGAAATAVAPTASEGSDD